MGFGSGIKVGDLYGELRLDKSKFDTDIKDAGLSFGTLAKVAGAAALVVVGALAGVGGAAIDVAANFQTSMANIHTLIGPGSESDARIADLGQSVKDVSVETGKSLTDLAGGLYQITSAFGDTADSGKILELAAKASSAGLATTTDSVNLLSSVTKGYGDTSAAAVEKASDLAFQTVKLGQTTFPELAASMGRAVPLAKALGVSQEELFGAMATLTGVTGNTAEVTTQLRATYQALLNTNPEMVAALKKIGFESGEAAIKSLGFEGTIQALSESVGGNTKSLAGMFGSVESLNAVLALTGPQAQNMIDKTLAMGEAAGATSEAFDIQQGTIQATGARLKASFDVILASIGEKLLPILADLLDWISANLPNIQSILEGAFSGVGAGIDFFSTTILPGLQAAFAIITEQVIPAVSAAFEYITTNILPPIQAAFTAIAENLLPILSAAFNTVVSVIQENWPTISSIVESVAGIVRGAIEVISAVIKAVAPVVRWLAETIFPILGKAAGVLLGAIKIAFDAIKVIFDAGLAAGKFIVAGLTTAFQSLVGVFQFVGNVISQVFRTAMNFLIGIVNAVIRAVNSIQVHIGRIGLDTPAGFIGVGPFDWNGLQLGQLKYLAQGTDNWPGGWAMLGEQGPELARLPRGTQVFPAGETKDMMGGGRVEKHYHLQVMGNIVANSEPSVLATLQRLAEVTA